MPTDKEFDAWRSVWLETSVAGLPVQLPPLTRHDTSHGETLPTADYLTRLLRLRGMQIGGAIIAAVLCIIIVGFSGKPELFLMLTSLALLLWAFSLSKEMAVIWKVWRQFQTADAQIEINLTEEMLAGRLAVKRRRRRFRRDRRLN